MLIATLYRRNTFRYNRKAISTFLTRRRTEYVHPVQEFRDLSSLRITSVDGSVKNDKIFRTFPRSQLLNKSYRPLSVSSKNFENSKAVVDGIFFDKTEENIENDRTESSEKNLCGQIGFLGCGKMAEAILEGITRNQIQDPKSILVTDIHHSRMKYFQEKFGVTPKENVEDVIQSSDLLLCCVKPQNLSNDLFGSGEFKDDCIFVSIIAGVPLEEFRELTGLSKIVRSMPNTPATIQQGMTVWADTGLDEADRYAVSTILSSLGDQERVSEEKYLDMATAISGSGPAYVLLVLEAMIDTGVHMGFPRHLAEKLVFQTVAGTTEYAMQANKHVAVLRNDITSPGGTTASALYELEKRSLRTVLSDGLWAAYRKSLELGKKPSSVGPGRMQNHNVTNANQPPPSIPISFTVHAKSEYDTVDVKSSEK